MNFKKVSIVSFITISLLCVSVFADLSIGGEGTVDDILFPEEISGESGDSGSLEDGDGGSSGGGGGGSSFVTSDSDETIILPYDPPISTEKTMSFKDVSEKNWFYDDVLFVYNRNIMTGTSEDEFSPNATLTRAMMITVIHRLSGEDAVSAENIFTDVVKDTWYEDAVRWGYENKIVSGVGNGKFSPMGNLTREQLCVMLYNYTKHLNKKTDKAELTSFADYKSVSSWATDAVSWAVDAGIITGKGDGILAPRDGATRAEMATCIRRYIEKVVEGGGK